VPGYSCLKETDRIVGWTDHRTAIERWAVGDRKDGAESLREIQGKGSEKRYPIDTQRMPSGGKQDDQSRVFTHIY